MRSPVAVPAVVLMLVMGLLMPGTVAGAAAPARGNLDEVTLVANRTAVRISGWAVDPSNPTGSNTQVHIYVAGAGSSDVTDEWRPDVNAALGTTGVHGFIATVPVPFGRSEVCAFAISAVGAGNALIGCRTVERRDGLPAVGSFDAATLSPDGGTVTASGWAFMPGQVFSGAIVEVFVDGVRTLARADLDRPDVTAAFDVVGGHGFSVTAPTPRGPRTVCVFARRDTNPGSPPTPLGCLVVDGRGKLPAQGSLDTVGVNADGTQAVVTGWTLDPDAPAASTEVHVYVDGHGYARTANGDRADVNSVLGVPGRHGFAETIPLRTGGNQLCAFAISTSGGGNTLLGCRSIRPKPVLGSLDAITVSPDGTQATLSGWAVDLNEPDAWAAPVIVGDEENLNDPLRFTADRPRPDVNAVVGVGGDHGFVITVPLHKSWSRLCAYVSSRRVDAPGPGMWCREVQGPPEPTEAPTVTGVTTSADASGRSITVTGRHLSGHALHVELLDATTGEFQWESRIQPLHTEGRFRMTVGSQVKAGTYRLVISTSAGEVTTPTFRLPG